MPKQEAIVDAISENLEELRTLLDERANSFFTSDDFSEEQKLINNIEILLMQLQWAKKILRTLCGCWTTTDNLEPRDV